jgi:hypothetical protein
MFARINIGLRAVFLLVITFFFWWWSLGQDLNPIIWSNPQPFALMAMVLITTLVLTHVLVMMVIAYVGMTPWIITSYWALPRLRSEPRSSSFQKFDL